MFARFGHHAVLNSSPSLEKKLLLTVNKGLDILWEHHFKTQSSARQHKSHITALNQSMGNVCLSQLTDAHILRHIDLRRAGKIGTGPVGETTIRHDLKDLITLLNMVRRWKRKKYTLGGVSFEIVDFVDVQDLFDGVKRPKYNKRRRTALPSEFSKVYRHADRELQNLLENLIDTGARLQDALFFEPKHYNPYTDQVEWTQQKTGIFQVLPVSSRVRRHFLEARREGKKFVYDRVNLRDRWEKARKKAGCPDLQIGRDFRKTTYNETRKFTKDPDAARQHLGHTSIKTGDDYYYIEERKDLRPVVRHLEKKFISTKNYFSRRKILCLPSERKVLT